MESCKFPCSGFPEFFFSTQCFPRTTAATQCAEKTPLTVRIAGRMKVYCCKIRRVLLIKYTKAIQNAFLKPEKERRVFFRLLQIHFRHMIFHSFQIIRRGKSHLDRIYNTFRGHLAKCQTSFTAQSRHCCNRLLCAAKSRRKLLLLQHGSFSGERENETAEFLPAAMRQ